MMNLMEAFVAPHAPVPEIQSDAMTGCLQENRSFDHSLALKGQLDPHLVVLPAMISSFSLVLTATDITATIEKAKPVVIALL